MKSRNAILHSPLRDSAPGIYSFTIMADIPSIGTAESHRLCQSLLSQLEVFHQAVIEGTRPDAGLKIPLTGARVGQVLDDLDIVLSQHLNHGSLINRDKKIPIELSEAGEVVHDFAKEILDRMHDMVGQLHRSQHETELKVATINIVLLKYGDELRARFKQALPESVLTIRTFGQDGYPEKILAEVREGRADIGITSYPPDVPAPFTVQPLRDTEVGLVFNANHPRVAAFGHGPLRLTEVSQMDQNFQMALHRSTIEGPFAMRVRDYLRKFPDLRLRRVEGETIADLIALVKKFPNTGAFFRLTPSMMR
jgi:DNA-binding transcriptional LysR family regulator